MITFQDLNTLIEQAVDDEACEKYMDWLHAQHSLNDALVNAEKIFRLWALEHGYIQFAEHCDWSQLTSSDWSLLLVHQPQFASKCDFSNFNEFQWPWLLIHQPQFASKCSCWSRFNNFKWQRLLIAQPQFAVYCDCWSQFDHFDWWNILKYQPQLVAYRETQTEEEK